MANKLMLITKKPRRLIIIMNIKLEKKDRFLRLTCGWHDEYMSMTLVDGMVASLTVNKFYGEIDELVEWMDAFNAATQMVSDFLREKIAWVGGVNNEWMNSFSTKRTWKRYIQEIFAS